MCAGVRYCGYSSSQIMALAVLLRRYLATGSTPPTRPAVRRSSGSSQSADRTLVVPARSPPCCRPRHRRSEGSRGTGPGWRPFQLAGGGRRPPEPDGCRRCAWPARHRPVPRHQITNVMFSHELRRGRNAHVALDGNDGATTDVTSFHGCLRELISSFGSWDGPLAPDTQRWSRRPSPPPVDPPNVPAKSQVTACSNRTKMYLLPEVDA